MGTPRKKMKARRTVEGKVVKEGVANGTLVGLVTRSGLLRPRGKARGRHGVRPGRLRTERRGIV